MSERILIEAEQFWNVEHSIIADLSHWRSVGRWVDEDKWRKIGLDNFYRFQQLCRLAEFDYENSKIAILEWGVGGGSNAITFSKIAEVFYGVDISPASLEESARQMSLIGFTNFQPIKIDITNNRLSEIKQIDFVLSTSCFQHFPSKEYGESVLAIMNSLLKDNGVALIQIRYDDNSPTYSPKQHDYLRNAVTFTSYRLDEFWNLLSEIELTPLAIQLDSANYAYYFIQKKHGKNSN